jgi:hypothetical protein
MALLVLLFFDLATVTHAKGDDALYRKILADRKQGDLYNVALDGTQCIQVARNGSDLRPFAEALEKARGPYQLDYKIDTVFSRIGWLGHRAWVELKTSDATSCLLYQRAGASFRLVREIRLPH